MASSSNEDLQRNGKSSITQHDIERQATKETESVGVPVQKSLGAGVSRLMSDFVAPSLTVCRQLWQLVFSL